ncbi:unnamed protein product [Penicillium discolor]
MDSTMFKDYTTSLPHIEEGKPLDKYRVNRMLATLKTHADARRYDQAEKIATDFKELATKGYTAAYTDPIERPPVHLHDWFLFQ